MRWITLLLLIVNLCLFGWYWQQDQQRQRAFRGSQELPDVPSLRLLSEGAMPQRKVAEEPAQSGGETTAAEIEEVVTDAGTEAASAPVGELTASVAALSPVSQGVLSQTEPPAARQSYCYRLRYLDTIEEANAVANLAGVIDSRIDEQRQALEPDHWVYIPNPGRSAERRAIRKELSDMGFENYWIQRGVLKGQLSLGLYRHRGSAEALQDLLKGRGYDVKLYTKERYSLRYLVEILTLSTSEEAQALADLIGKRFPGTKSEKKLCEGLASVKGAE